MFRHHRHLHRWACRMLVAWLFSVASGVANACLVADVATAVGGQRSETVVAAGVRTAPAGKLDHGTHVAPHERGQGHGTPAAKANCQDFCDKSGVSVPSVKTAADDAGGHALAFPAVLTVLPVPQAPPVRRVVPGPEGAHAPPITIAFLRLAL